MRVPKSGLCRRARGPSEYGQPSPKKGSVSVTTRASSRGPEIQRGFGVLSNASQPYSWVWASSSLGIL